MIDKFMHGFLNRVYGYDDYTQQEINSKLIQKIDEVIENCNLAFEFLEWLKEQGLSDEVINTLLAWKEDGTFDSIINKHLFNELNTLIETKANANEISKFQKISRFTKGYSDNGGVLGVIANSNNPTLEICEYINPKHTTQYTDRDSVSLYVQNNGTMPTVKYQNNDATYTINSVTLPSLNDIEFELLNEGMVIDTLHTPYRWCGIIETINKTTKTIKIQEGWYQINNNTTVTTPTNGVGLEINKTTKIFGINNVVKLENPNTTAHAVAEEIDLLKNTGSGTIGGIDLCNLGDKAVFGLTIRDADNGSGEGFQFGVVATKCDKAFESRNTKPGAILLSSQTNEDYNNYLTEGFSIFTNGVQSKLKFYAAVITDKTKIPASHQNVIFYNLSNYTDQPSFLTPDNHDGEVKFIKNINTTKLQLMGSFVTPRGESMNVHRLECGQSIVVVSDGSRWHIICDSEPLVRLGNSANRPSNPSNGQRYFDTQILKEIIYFNGNWYCNGVSV